MKNKHSVEVNFPVIIHVDLDCFFVSASSSKRKDPSLIETAPLGVAHASSNSTDSNSTSDIASCNYVARSFGIKNGMSVQKARMLCPQLQLLPYEFELYSNISRHFYRILSEYTCKMEAVSCDEAYLDISAFLGEYSEDSLDFMREKILQIKTRIHQELKINA